MSTKRVCKLAIKNADLNTLKEAVRQLATMIGADVATRVSIYGGRVENVPTGVTSEALPNGIGFEVQNGEVVSIGDSWGYDKEYSRVETLLKQTYGYVDSMTKLRTRGYMVNAQAKVHQNKLTATIVGNKMGMSV